MSGSASDSDSNVVDDDSTYSHIYPFSVSVLTKLEQNDPSQTQLVASDLDARGPEITKLYHALQQNTVLEGIDFYSPTVMAEGSNEFLRILSEGKFRLKSLEINCELSRENPSFFGFSCDLLRILSTASCTKNSLERLFLEWGTFAGPCGNEGDGVKESLFDIFVDIPSLRNVSLADEQIRPNGLLGLAQGLAENKSVVDLDLSGNRYMGNPLVYSRLAESLVANKTLTELAMINCDLNDSGMATLLTALQENQTLRALSLNSNNFTRHGIETVLVPLLPGLNLERLCLKKNLGNNYYFGNDTTEQECDRLVERIVMSLQNNSTLEVLELNYCFPPGTTVSLYPWGVQKKRKDAGKPFYSTLDQRLQLYLGPAHRGFNKFWQLRLAENDCRRTADRNNVGPTLVPLRLLVPRVLYRLYQACHSRELDADLYFYVRKMAEWGDFGERQGTCRRGAS